MYICVCLNFISIYVLQEYGRPTLMVTITPSSFNQFIVALRAGFENNNDNALTLNDIFLLKKELPLQVVINDTASKDPALAAEYFIEIINFFLRK